MATITGLTAEQMLKLSDSNITGATISALGNLILTTRGGGTIDAGSILPPTMGKGLSLIREQTIASGSTTGLMVVTNIPSFTFLANRWYEIDWRTGIFGTTTSSTAAVQIHSCATADAANAVTGLTQLMGYNITLTSQVLTANPNRKIKYQVDTTLQIKATINGNGSAVTALGGGSWPSQLTIKDIGM